MSPKPKDDSFSSKFEKLDRARSNLPDDVVSLFVGWEDIVAESNAKLSETKAELSKVRSRLRMLTLVITLAIGFIGIPVLVALGIVANVALDASRKYDVLREVVYEIRIDNVRNTQPKP